MSDLTTELRRADHCHGIVTRDYEQDACGKPPVAIIDARDAEDGCYWPACAYHAHRYGAGHVVPLAAIVAAITEGRAEQTIIPRIKAGAERRGYERGRAEVSAAVEAVLNEWLRTEGVGSLLVVDELRAALTDPAAAVARIKAEAWDEGAAEGIRMHNRHQAWMLVNPYRADRIGGAPDA